MLSRRVRARPIATLFLAALTALAAGAGEARAGAPTEAEIAQARARFAEGRRLEDAGRFAEALSLFQRVAEVKMTPQIRFHLALCLEHVGMWTQALEVYAQAAEEAGAAVPEVVKEANEHRQKLEATLPTVVLRVTDRPPEPGLAPSPGAPSPGDELLLDRRPLPAGGAPIRVDPGPHTAEVRRGGAVVAREIFAVDPGATRVVDLRIGAVAPAPAEPATPTAPAKDAAPVHPTGRAQRAIGWVAVGAGATSAVVAGVFIGLRAGAMSRLDGACPSLMQCPTSVAPIVSEGKADAALVDVFVVVGGVAAAAGVALLLISPPAAARPAPVSARIELHADGTLRLRGSF